VVEFVVGVVAGASAAAMLLIILGPSRRVRAEKRLERDVETRLLLGEDPDEPLTPPESPAIDHPRHYSEKDLAELRRLGSSPKRKKR
jgi:hypothetical protein